MRIAVLMNELSTLKQVKDTSLAFLRRAHSMGWDCFYFTADDLFCRDGHAFTQVYALTGLGGQHELVESMACGVEPLASFDIILMRLDPPFNTEYIYATYVLELAERAGVLVANKPRGLRDVSEKFAILHAPQCCPATLVSRSIEPLKAFWHEHRQVVFKPLDGMGGRSIFYVGEEGHNLQVILDTLTQSGQMTIMAQSYIPALKTTGDKRILLIDGQPVPYALARFPGEGEWRGNLALGGRGEVVPITSRDRWICQEIAPFLREHGLSFVGIDVIGDYLTEINVTSPTCVVEIEAATGLDIAGDYLHYLKKCFSKSAN